jgi:beta-lactamase superfamily II metal-dependent hydrolase
MFLRIFTTYWAPNSLFQTPYGESDVVWVSVNVGDSPYQGDAHVIAARGGPVFLIDGGQFSKGRELLLPFLKRYGITHIDKAFITHAHNDHYGGIIELLESGYLISELYWDEPNSKFCEGDSPWGCVASDIERLKQISFSLRMEVKSISGFTAFDLGPYARFEKVFSTIAEKCPTEKCTMNDLSLISKLEIGGNRILFAGDLDKNIGGWLSNRDSSELRAKFLKFPHHGASPLPPNSFLEKVSPEVVVVPAYYSLWCSEQNKTGREWLLARKNTRIYVGGAHGHIFIHFFKDGRTWTGTQFNLVLPLSCDSSKVQRYFDRDLLTPREVCHQCTRRAQ